MRLSKYVFIIPDEENKTKYILFNSATFTFYEIDKIILNKILSGKLDNKRLITILQNSLFVVNDTDREEFFCQELLNKRKYNIPYLDISVLVTDDCNLRCNYCYTKYLKEKIKMNEKIANCLINWIEYLFTFNTYNRKIYLSFSGGEPLLNVPIIKHIGTSIKNLAKKYAVELSTTILTNGTLVDINLIKQLEDIAGLQRIQISLDGPPDLHNSIRFFSNQQDTFSIIEKNILNILKETKTQVIIALLLTADNMDRQLELFKIIKEWKKHDCKNQLLGIKPGGCFLPVFCRNVIESDPPSLTPGKWGEIINKVIEKANQYDIQIFLKGMLQPTHCVARSLTSFIVAPRGDIYKCPNTVGLNEFCIGNVFEGINQSKHSKLVGSKSACFIDNNKQCQQCNYAFLCHGGCLTRAYYDTQDYYALDCQREFFDIALMPMIKYLINRKRAKLAKQNDNFK